METRYVKLNHGEALSAKKELLSSEINILQITKKLKEYRKLRKREFTLKGKLKTSMGLLKTKVNLLLSSFPQGEPNMPKPKKSKREKSVSKGLQDELEEIQKKLTRLKS